MEKSVASQISRPALSIRVKGTGWEKTRFRFLQVVHMLI